MSPLRDYLAQIQQAVSSFPGSHVEQYWEQLLATTRANLRIRLRLADNSLLEISEALLVERGRLAWLTYRYHWQTATGHMILRYDNAPHHPEIETFPDHKHVRETTVVASQRPGIPDLFAEIQHLLSTRH